MVEDKDKDKGEEGGEELDPKETKMDNAFKRLRSRTISLFSRGDGTGTLPRYVWSYIVGVSGGKQRGVVGK